MMALPLSGVINSGEILKSFKTKETVLFSRDGSRVALASASREIEIHSVTSGEKIYTLPGSSHPVYFAPDGKSLVTGYKRGIAAQWDLQTGKSIKIFEQPTEGLLWKDDFESGSLDLSIWKSSPDDSFSVNPFPHPGGEYSLVSEPIHNGTAAIELILDNPETCVAFRYQLIGSSKEAKIEFRTDDKTHKLFFDHDRQCNSTVIIPFNEIKKDIKQRVYRWEIANNDSSKNLSSGVRLVIDTIRISSDVPVLDIDAACFCSTPDGENLLVGGLHCYSGRSTWDPCSGQVRMWNYLTGEYLKKYTFGYSVHNIALSPGGKTMLVYPDFYGMDQPVQQIDIDSGKMIQSVTGHIAVPSPLYFDNGSKVLMGTTCSVIKIFDAADFHEIKRFEGHTSSVQNLAASKDGNKILLNCADRIFRLWDVKTDSLQSFQYKGMPSFMMMDLSPDGTKAIFWDYSNPSNLLTIHLETGNRLHKYEKNSGQYPKFSPDGRWIFTVKDASSFLVWDATTDKLVRKFPKAEGFSEYVISPDSSMVLFQGYKDDVLLCETTNGAVLHSFPHPEKIGLRNLSFCPDGKECLTSNCNAVFFWDIANGSKKDTFVIPAEWKIISFVDYYRDSNHIIIGTYNEKIYILDRKSFVILYELSGNFKNMKNLVISNQGSLVIALTQYPEYSLYTWNLPLGDKDFLQK